MGITYYTCSQCADNFPDCGRYANCEGGHKLCDYCSRPSLGLVEGLDGDILSSSCPCCVSGGTKLERAQKRIAELEQRVRDLEDECRRAWGG